MNQQLKAKVELFENNIQALKGAFVWKNILTRRFAALLYAAQNKQINIGELQEGHDLIKENTGAFSCFRGNSAMIVSTLLSFYNDKRWQLSNALTVYERMKANKFWASDYLVVSAYQIAGGTEKEKFDETIKRTKAFYDGMKARHRLITGQNDYIFAAMLALSDMKVEEGIKQIEELHQALKPHFRSGDGVQTLSQVLTLGGQSCDTISRVTDLSGRFRQRGLRFDRALTLPSLGVLSLLPANADVLADEAVEVYELLRTKKGFGRWSVSQQELLLLSAALVSFHYTDGANSNLLTTTLSTTITNIIVAQQTAIAVVIATSSSAAASSGS